MDRRTFLIRAAWLPAAWSPAAGGSGWLPLARAATRDGTLAIVDRTLADAGSFERYAARVRLRTFVIGDGIHEGSTDDIGMLWYTTLAPLMSTAHDRQAPALVGLTRGSDYFVLAELATRAGHRLTGPPHRARGVSSARRNELMFAFVPTR